MHDDLLTEFEKNYLQVADFYATRLKSNSQKLTFGLLTCARLGQCYEEYAWHPTLTEFTDIQRLIRRAATVISDQDRKALKKFLAELDSEIEKTQDSIEGASGTKANVTLWALESNLEYALRNEDRKLRAVFKYAVDAVGEYIDLKKLSAKHARHLCDAVIGGLGEDYTATQQLPALSNEKFVELTESRHVSGGFKSMLAGDPIAESNTQVRLPL